MLKSGLNTSNTLKRSCFILGQNKGQGQQNQPIKLHTMLLFRGWSIELGPVSWRNTAWSQNHCTHILSLANDKIYRLHYFSEPKRLQAKFSTCSSSYNRQKQHRRKRNCAHKCIYFYTTMDARTDGWMDKQTGSKSNKDFINVILLTFLSIKSKAISAIAKHVIRLEHQ